MGTFTVIFDEESAKVTHEHDGNMEILKIEGENIEVKDEYHTMDELYEHRMALNVALFNLLDKIAWNDPSNPIVIKSKLHNDGTMFEGGYFIVACRDPQISYHYKLKHWDKFQIPEVERIPWEYDGHTSEDVIERLMKI
jgi:hypothetical protein